MPRSLMAALLALPLLSGCAAAVPALAPAAISAVSAVPAVFGLPKSLVTDAREGWATCPGGNVVVRPPATCPANPNSW